MRRAPNGKLMPREALVRAPKGYRDPAVERRTSLREPLAGVLNLVCRITAHRWRVVKLYGDRGYRVCERCHRLECR